MKVRNELIKKRKNNDWSQEDVARMLDTSQQVISFIEQGKRNPSLIIAKKMEKIYKTPMEELFPDIFLDTNTTMCNIKDNNHTA